MSDWRKSPQCVARSKYGGRVGNGFVVGVVGHAALTLLNTVGSLPQTWRDHWVDGVAEWDWPLAAEPPVWRRWRVVVGVVVLISFDIV